MTPNETMRTALLAEAESLDQTAARDLCPEHVPTTEQDTTA